MQKELAKLKEELTQQSSTQVREWGAPSRKIKEEAALLEKPTDDKPITGETVILDKSGAPLEKTVQQVQPKNHVTEMVIQHARSQLARRWTEISQMEVEEVCDPPVDFWDDQIQKRCLLLQNAQEYFLRFVRGQVRVSGSLGDTVVKEISRHKKETDTGLSAHILAVRQKIREQKDRVV